MALLIALLLALFVLDDPWATIVVVGALVLEVGEIFFWFWYSKRRHIQVGAETLIGERAVVIRAARPRGQVRLQGETWDAVSAAGANEGERVVVVGRDGLTLMVEAEEAAPPPPS